MDDIIELVAQSYTTDQLKQKISTETVTSVWAHIRSVSRDEWFQGGQVGLDPSLVIITPKVNYDGQKIVRLGGKQYTVYRTYAADKSDDVELYLAERAGDVGKGTE